MKHKLSTDVFGDNMVYEYQAATSLEPEKCSQLLSNGSMG